MPAWSPVQYGTFLDRRTRPSRDLVQRVNLTAPRQIIDLGCGPGNSTAVCAERWPEASILGLDSSPEMIAAARAAQPGGHWSVGDITEWAMQPAKPGDHPDLIFSSAALQWVEDHGTVFPRLLEKLAPGGVLAVQMPSYDAAPNRTMREMAASEQWRPSFPDGRAKEWRAHPLEFYYARLGPTAKWLDLWSTEYLEIMSDVGEIVEWYTSTGLRPYLDPIQDAGQRREFLDEFRARLDPLYPKSEAGGVPFLFKRLFIVAGV